MRILNVAVVAALALAGCAGTGPGPEASELLSGDDVEELAAVFDDQPLNEAQSPWPNHQLKWIDEDTFFFLAFDAADPTEAENLLWIGLGVRGVFCEDDRPTPDFTHFHRSESSDYGSGHGGEPGQPGFWLLHANVAQFESPFGDTGRQGIHEEFNPSDAPSCQEEEDDGMVPPLPPPVGDEPEDDPDSEPAEKGSRLSTDDIVAIAAVFDDQPLSESQQPWPAHLIKWVNDETFIFIQFDEADPEDAERVLWVGMGVLGEFCVEDRPDADFSHFHRFQADRYGEGHHGDPGQSGFWLLHIATHDFDSPFGPTGGPGVQDDFATSDAPAC